MGDTVILDGSGSIDPEGRLLSYAWQLLSAPAGSLAALSDPAAVKPSFDVDLPGDYVVELTVSGEQEASTPDTVTISTVSSAPVADAGPD